MQLIATTTTKLSIAQGECIKLKQNIKLYKNFNIKRVENSRNYNGKC